MAVGGEQLQPLNSGLGQEHPVEWVAMKWREGGYGESMLTPDRQFTITIKKQTTSELGSVHVEILAPQARLNHDLPNACGAENEFGLGVIDHRPRPLRQPVRQAGGTEQLVRIK